VPDEYLKRVIVFHTQRVTSKQQEEKEGTIIKIFNPAKDQSGNITRRIQSCTQVTVLWDDKEETDVYLNDLKLHFPDDSRRRLTERIQREDARARQ